MKRVDRIIDVLETIRSLELQILAASDPRDKADMAHTLDMLNNSLKFEVERYTTEQGRDNEVA